jgi:endonuclease IV
MDKTEPDWGIMGEGHEPDLIEMAEHNRRVFCESRARLLSEQEAIRYLGLWNPRFTMYRRDDPTFRQDEVERLAKALREVNEQAEQRGRERGIEEALKIVRHRAHRDSSVCTDTATCGERVHRVYSGSILESKLTALTKEPHQR